LTGNNSQLNRFTYNKSHHKWEQINGDGKRRRRKADTLAETLYGFAVTQARVAVPREDGTAIIRARDSYRTACRRALRALAAGFF